MLLRLPLSGRLLCEGTTEGTACQVRPHSQRTARPATEGYSAMIDSGLTWEQEAAPCTTARLCCILPLLCLSPRGLTRINRPSSGMAKPKPPSYGELSSGVTQHSNTWTQREMGSSSADKWKVREIRDWRAVRTSSAGKQAQPVNETNQRHVPQGAKPEPGCGMRVSKPLLTLNWLDSSWACWLMRCLSRMRRSQTTSTVVAIEPARLGLVICRRGMLCLLPGLGPRRWGLPSSWKTRELGFLSALPRPHISRVEAHSNSLIDRH